MGMSQQAAPAVQQAAQQLPQSQANTNSPNNQTPTPQGQSFTAIASPNGTTNPFQTLSQGGKGGPPPSPQQLSQGLQQQAAIQQAAGQMGKGGQPPAPNSIVNTNPSQGQTPMSMQRQPQGGMAGPTASRMPRQPRPRGFQVR